MSEVDLSDDYANAKYISNAKSFPEKWQEKSTNFRNERASFSNMELDIPYGPSHREKMDIFYPQKRTTGVFVFVHGEFLYPNLSTRIDIIFDFYNYHFF